MPIDYIVASLPQLTFGLPAPLTREQFVERCGGEVELPVEWTDLEAELRNAMVEARSGGSSAAMRFLRPVSGCRLYWRNRITACFQERDVLKREDLLDRVWWDAAGELVSSVSPLGKGALAAYSIRLELALKRDRISTDDGNAAFDRLTAETRR